jgi:hypothetical protein
LEAIYAPAEQSQCSPHVSLASAAAFDTMRDDEDRPMTFVKFKVPGGGEIAVRREDVFALAPDSSTVDDDTEIWWDGPREALALEPLAQVAQKLGPDFVAVPAASTTFQRYVVNRKLVTAIIPHPQVAGVCFLQGKSRRIAAKGSLDELLAALGGG